MRRPPDEFLTEEVTEGEAAQMMAQHKPIIEQAKMWASMPARLGKPSGSALHRLLTADRAGPPTCINRPSARRRLSGIVAGDTGGCIDSLAYSLGGRTWGEHGCKNAPWHFHRSPPLVVCHDWARLLEAEAVTGPYRLPFPDCTIEMVLSGCHVVTFARDLLEEGSPRWFAAAELGKTWISIDTRSFYDPILKMIDGQIRALCLALDADVAELDVPVVPSRKLNAKRSAAGKSPLTAYRVVNLARRHRQQHSTATGNGTRPRLHWVRGYYRNSPRRAWVKTYIRGNPELGFINKEYRL